MINVRVSTTVPKWNWLLQQTPNSQGVWGDCKFFTEQDVKECDFWVVIEGLFETQTCYCPPENTLLITMEPYRGLYYPQKFLQQFGNVLTFHPDIRHPKIIYDKSANLPVSWPWMINKNYDELKNLQSFTKHRVLSAICSNKVVYPGHVKRIEFMAKLVKRLDVDFYGRGIREFKDKWDVIAPYKYHVAIENSNFPNFFTEKLTDSFLCWTYPFYYGCPNLSKYFPEGSFTMIDVDDVEGSVKKIKEAITDNVYEKAIDKIQVARELILDRYDLAPVIFNIIHSLKLKVAKKNLTLIPARDFLGLNVRILNRVSTEFLVLRTRKKVRDCISQLSRKE